MMKKSLWMRCYKLKKDTVTEIKASLKKQPLSRNNPEVLETGLPEEKSPDDMEIFE